MKKFLLLTVLMLSVSIVYSQDSVKVKLFSDTINFKVVSDDSLKVLKKKIKKEVKIQTQDQVKTQLEKQEISQTLSLPQIQTQPETKIQIQVMPESRSKSEDMSVDKLKTALSSIVKNSGDTMRANNMDVVITGNNIIVGNNNVIVVVEDKTKAKDVLGLIKDKSEKKQSADKEIEEKKVSEDISPIDEKKKSYFTKNLFEHFSIALGASTFGPGIELATSFSRNIEFRAGFNIIDYSANYTVGLRDDKIKDAVVGKYNPDYKFKATANFYNGHALFDLYPMRGGVFHITAGLYIGESKLKADGRLVNPETGADTKLDSRYPQWPDANFADYQVAIDREAKLVGEAKLGNWLKPYVGIGFGRSIPKKNLGIKFELGAMYQGDFVLKQNGNELSKNKSKDDSFADNKDYIKWLKWYPIVNLQLVYRFK